MSALTQNVLWLTLSYYHTQPELTICQVDRDDALIAVGAILNRTQQNANQLWTHVSSDSHPSLEIFC